MEKYGAKSASVSLSPLAEDKEEPRPVLRATFCLKNRERVQEFEEMEDCFMLDFDPYSSNSFDFSSLSTAQNPDNDCPPDANISIIAERGQVACRDFPHSRHQCLKFPFGKTPHDKYCQLCYCYVCDIAAPCTQWPEHCHATHTHASDWWYLRRDRRGQEFDSDSDSGYHF